MKVVQEKIHNICNVVPRNCATGKNVKTLSSYLTKKTAIIILFHKFILSWPPKSSHIIGQVIKNG